LSSTAQSNSKTTTVDVAAPFAFLLVSSLTEANCLNYDIQHKYRQS